MKKLLTILIFLASISMYAQPKIDYLIFRGKFTTAERNLIEIDPGGAAWGWNVDTQQFEWADDSEVWQAFSAGGGAADGLGTARDVGPFTVVDADNATLNASAVATANIQDDAVTAAKIPTGAVGSDEIANSGVTGLDILDGTVDTDDLADAAVTAVKIQNSTITANKLAGFGGVSPLVIDVIANESPAPVGEMLEVANDTDFRWVTKEQVATDGLDDATLVDIGTPASDDQVLIKDTSNSGTLRYVDWADVGGGGGSGDVTGPASSTDNTIPRFDGAGGKTLQTSALVINDNGEISGGSNSGTATTVLDMSGDASFPAVEFTWASGSRLKVQEELSGGWGGVNGLLFQMNNSGSSNIPAIIEGWNTENLYISSGGLGADDIIFLSGRSEVARIDASGNFTLDGTVDGVDVSAMAADIFENNDIAIPAATIRYADIDATSSLVLREDGTTDMVSFSGDGTIDFPNAVPTIVPEVYNEATFDNNDEILDKGTFRDVVEGKINSDITGEPSGAYVLDNIVGITRADLAAGTPVSGTTYVVEDPIPAEVVTTATIAMEGWKMYDDQTADAGTITLSDCDPGETLTVYINRASAPTLAGTGLTFNQLPNTTAFAAATQMAIYFEVSHDGTTVDYFYFER